MYPAVFYFNFYDPETEVEKYYAFTMTLTNGRLNEEFDDSYDQMFDQVESEYGVHDWSTRPNDAVIGFGYTSYEVDPDKYEYLMNLWNGYFAAHKDVFSIGTVVEVTGAEGYNDLGIYNAAKTVEAS